MTVGRRDLEPMPEHAAVRVEGLGRQRSASPAGRARAPAAHSPAAAGGGGLRQGRGPVLTVRSRPRRPAGRRRPGLARGAARPGWGGLRADAAPMSAAGALASLRVRRARGSCGSGSQPRRSGPRSRGAGSPRRCAAPCSADSERCGAVSPRSHARAGPGKSCRRADGERRWLM